MWLQCKWINIDKNVIVGLYLDFTQVTDAGLKELKEALPKCEIIH